MFEILIGPIGFAVLLVLAALSVTAWALADIHDRRDVDEREIGRQLGKLEAIEIPTREPPKARERVIDMKAYQAHIDEMEREIRGDVA